MKLGNRRNTCGPIYYNDFYAIAKESTRESPVYRSGKFCRQITAEPVLEMIDESGTLFYRII